jgi:hypothetical protein
MILIQKCISEDPDKRILVVSRLSRLISFVKSAVGNEKRDTSNISLFTYEDLLNHLSRRVNPMEESAVWTFAAFHQVHLGEMTGTGAASSISFEQDSVNGFLEEGKRNAMKKHLVEPITLWGAFRVIKLNVKCSETKAPLSREDYLEPCRDRLDWTRYNVHSCTSCICNTQSGSILGPLNGMKQIALFTSFNMAFLSFLTQNLYLGSPVRFS